MSEVDKQVDNILSNFNGNTEALLKATEEAEKNAAEEKKKQLELIKKLRERVLKEKGYFDPNYAKISKRNPFTPTALKNKEDTVIDKDNLVHQVSGPLYHDEAFDAEEFKKHEWDYKRDEQERGWAPGMDDLARILLDNKSVVKFNKTLCTPQSAAYWVEQKNKTITNPDKKWRVIEFDVNKDGEDEVLVIDGNGNIRYLDGYHLGKSKINLHKLHQREIESKYGNPGEIRKKRIAGEIPKGWLSMRKFIYDNTEVNEQNPDGALIVYENLEKAGYKSRPLNPCNLFMKYITKPIFQRFYATNEFKALPEDKQKLFKKMASIIQINANFYTAYVANKAQQQLSKEGYTDRAMKKKGRGEVFSPFSKKCGEIIRAIETGADPDANTIIQQMGTALTKAYYYVKGYSYSQALGDPFTGNENRRGNGSESNFDYSKWVASR